MSVVGIKNLLFPSRPGLEQHRRDSAAPLLPTCEPTTPRRQSSQHSGKCSRPDCPGVKEIPLERRPRRNSSSSSSSSTSLTSADDSSSSARWLDPRTMSDAIIGLSDGLTVPFALTAGLSAFNDTRVVIFGGCAELIAGSISMGLGGWLAGRGEDEFYNTTLSSTRSLVMEEEVGGNGVRELIYAVFEPYRIPREGVAPLVSALVRDRDDTVEFLMRFKHELPSREGSKRTPLRSALTIAVGYFVGGFVPLLPYFLVAKREVMLGLYWSVGVMAVCLFAFGVGRDFAVGERRGGWWGRVRGGLEMVAIGGVAAGASWGIVRALGDVTP